MIQNDPRMYTGGSAVLDSSPTVDTFARLQQRRQAEETAKNEALNKYFSELPKRVNTAGILDTHLFDDKEGRFPGLNTRINQLMEYGKQNMKEIGKGGEAKLAYDQMVNGVVMDIERAKQASKDTLEAAKMKIEGKIGMDDEDLTVFDKMTKSIYDKDAYKPDGVSRYGFMDFSANLPQFDPNKGFESWTKGLEGEKVFDESKKISDSQAGVVRVPYAIKLSPEMVTTAAMRAKNEYNSSREARAYWKNQYNKMSEEELKDLEKYFKKYVDGRQIKTPDGTVLDLSKIDSAEEYAMASAAKQAESFVKKEDYDTRPDKALAAQRAADNIQLNQQGRDGGGGGGVSGNAFDTIADNDGAKNFNIKGGYFYNKDGTPFNGNVFVRGQEIPSTIISTLKAGGINPIYVIQGVNATIKNGQVKSISNKLVGTITREAMQGVYQKKMDTERKGESLNFNNPEPTTTRPTPTDPQSVPTYKKADLIKKGWTQDQINTAVKAKKIKVI